jgi:RHS repeat-associated protein
MASDFDYRFSSEVFDSETGLVYYNYRYYSPELGRWLSRDLIEEDGGVNLYAMVSNNPIDNWDRYGLWSFYKWLYTGDGNASDESYNAGLARFGEELPFYNIITGEGFSGGASIVFFNSELIKGKCGCLWFCWGTTTDLAGIGVTAVSLGKSRGNNPVTVSVGAGKYSSFSGGDGTSDVNVGSPGFSALGPISISVRLACGLLTDYDKCGKRCDSKKPPVNLLKLPPENIFKAMK